MKKFYTLLTIVPLGWLAAIADGETPYQEMDYRYITQDGTTNWSAASWGIYPGASGGEAVDYEAAGISKYPNSNKVGIHLNWNLKQLNVDGEYTVGRIYANSSAGVT